MLIKRSEYHELLVSNNEQREKIRDYEAQLRSLRQSNSKLEAEAKRLAELVSAEVKDCHVGPWCKDCLHFGKEVASSIVEIGNGGYHTVEEGVVQFCKKHLHELCAEWTPKTEV